MHLKNKFKCQINKAKLQHEQKIMYTLTTLVKNNPSDFLYNFPPLRTLDEQQKYNSIPPSEWRTHFEKLFNIKPEINL